MSDTTEHGANVLSVAQDFLRRQGVVGAMLIVFAGMLWFDRQDRLQAAAENREIDRQHAAFVKDAAAQMQQFGMLLSAHADESEETVRVLRALCVNSAVTVDDRARCLGR